MNWLNAPFAVLLISVSALMVLHHAGTWRRDKMRTLPGVERDFLHRRYRRRVQTSLVIGGLGLIVFGSSWITTPSAVITFWMAALFGVFLLVANAAFDWNDSRTHYGKQRDQIFAERAQLEIQMRNRKYTSEKEKLN